jgi:hypothetical protein
MGANYACGRYGHSDRGAVMDEWWELPYVLKIAVLIGAVIMFFIIYGIITAVSIECRRNEGTVECQSAEGHWLIKDQRCRND